MKVIVKYSSDSPYCYESWYAIKDEKEDRFAKDVSSPWDEGVEALTAQFYYPVDNAIVAIFPAKSSQKKNDVNGDKYKGKYLLILSNVDETEKYNSYRMYSWEEASKIMYLLKDLSFKAALRVWKSKKY